jgi:hypothetical protein
MFVLTMHCDLNFVYMLRMKPCSMVGITILTLVVSKKHIVHCWSESNAPPFTFKTQFPSLWSVACNIQHLAWQHIRYTLWWYILSQSTVCHFCRPTMGNRWSHMMMSWFEWRPEWPETRMGPSTRSTAEQTFQEEDCGGETSRNTLFMQNSERGIHQGLCGDCTHCGTKVSWRCRDSD